VGSNPTATASFSYFRIILNPMIRWRFWRRKEKTQLSPEELIRLKRENEEARRGHGNPFELNAGLDGWVKSGIANAKSGTTPILGNELSSNDQL
jgi:hypothetical protein